MVDRRDYRVPVLETLNHFFRSVIFPVFFSKLSKPWSLNRYHVHSETYVIYPRDLKNIRHPLAESKCSPIEKLTDGSLVTSTRLHKNNATVVNVCNTPSILTPDISPYVAKTDHKMSWVLYVLAVAGRQVRVSAWYLARFCLHLWEFPLHAFLINGLASVSDVNIVSRPCYIQCVDFDVKWNQWEGYIFDVNNCSAISVMMLK